MNKPLRRTPLAVSIALIAALATGTFSAQAQAQGADTEVMEEIVTTGIRGSIQRAIDMKQASNSIVEAVSAEDLGKLPDTSIADSISRLPGLTSQRAEGRASAISLRGTDPGFTTALLNGREQVSTGDNRSVEFDQYPSELLNAVLVYKTPDSSLVGQGLAGTIDLRTVRPLNHSDRAFAFNVRGEMNGNDDLGAGSDEMGSRISLSYIDQYADGTVGLALGFARLDAPLATQGFGTYEPWGEVNLGNPDQNAGVPAGTFVTNGMKVRADLGDTQRNGFMAALQFAPNDTYSGIIDLYYSTMEQTNNVRSLEVNLSGYPGPCCDGGTFPVGTQFGYSNVTVANGVAVSGDVLQVVPLSRNFLFLTDDEVLSLGFNNEFFLNDDWSLVADLSYSKAKREQDQWELQATYLPQTTDTAVPFNQYTNATFQLNGTSSMPTLSVAQDMLDGAQLQVGPTIYGAGYTKAPEVEDEITAFRVDFVRQAEVGWFDELAFGVNFTDRTKEKIGPESGLGTIDGNWYSIDDRFLSGPMNLNYAGSGQVLAWDVPGVLNEYFDPITYGDPTTLPYLAGKYWDVEEDVWTVLLRGNLNHQLSGDVTLLGNVGVQVVGTDQSSSSFFVTRAFSPDQVVERVSDGTSYEHVLPQINLVFAMDEQAVRVGLAKEIARARMDQLATTEESGYDFATGIPGGSGGNAQLDPWEAWAFDISYERYFGEGEGYLSVAGFYKDLDTYIYDQTVSYDFTTLLENTPLVLFAPGVTPLTTGDFTRPVNGSGGKVQGLEFSASVPFHMFSESLDGIGAQFSYSLTDSDIAIQGSVSSIPINNIPLPGLSEDVWNLTLYYEKYGFGARINTRYRSEYLGEVTNFANERGFRFVDSDQITDLQLSYSFDEGRFDGLQLLFQINNLTNEPYIAYSQEETRVLDYQEYGTQYLLGLNYRY